MESPRGEAKARQDCSSLPFEDVLARENCSAVDWLAAEKCRRAIRACEEQCGDNMDYERGLKREYRELAEERGRRISDQLNEMDKKDDLIRKFEDGFVNASAALVNLTDQCSRLEANR